VFPLVYFPTAISGLMLLVEITRIVVIGVIPVVPVLLIFEILLAHLIAMLTLSASVFHFALSP
jgi:hypothetical protein